MVKKRCDCIGKKRLKYVLISLVTFICACTVGIAFWITSSRASSIEEKVVNDIDKTIVHPLFKPVEKKQSNSGEKLEKYRNMRQKAKQKMKNFDDKLINYSNSTQKTQVVKLSTSNNKINVTSTIKLTISTTMDMTRSLPSTMTSLFEAATLCKKLGLSKKTFRNPIRK